MLRWIKLGGACLFFVYVTAAVVARVLRGEDGRSERQWERAREERKKELKNFVYSRKNEYIRSGGEGACGGGAFERLPVL